MRFIVALLAALLSVSYYANTMEIDMPPRPTSRPEFVTCCHCRERDAYMFCEECGMAYCHDCDLAHQQHARI